MANIGNIRKLSDEQVQDFDIEYVTDDLGKVLAPWLDPFLSGESHFLDVGGGNGVFTDRVLQAYPSSIGINLEPSSHLANKNKRQLRKEVFNMPFENVAFKKTETFNVIFFNWVLHHFVASTYRQTVAAQIAALRAAADLLRPGGAVFIFENFYDGRIFDDLPSRIVYELTGSRTLRPITARLKANTAGVGVCFHSKSGWRRLLATAGLHVCHLEHGYHYGDFSLLKRILLHLKGVRIGLLIAARRGDSSKKRSIAA